LLLLPFSIFLGISLILKLYASYCIMNLRYTATAKTP
jgi:hypothetical protein